MTIEDKIAYLWNAAYERALGCSHPTPASCADEQVAPRVALLRAVERRQAHSNGLPQRGCRAGRRQAAERAARI